jgi:type IV pilus assembly protein PilN
MILINLLPVRARRRKVSASQLFYAYLAGVVVLLLCIAGIWIYQVSRIDQLNARLAQVKQEVSQYAKYEAMIQEMTKKKQVIDKKREIIRDLQRDRDTLVRMMALVSAMLPAEKIWLERLVQSSNGITLDGVALSNEAIAEFMRNLETSVYVVKGTVNLTHSRQTRMNEMKLREFQITYRFVPFSEAQTQAKAQGS